MSSGSDSNVRGNGNDNGNDDIRCGHCNSIMTTRHRCGRCRSVYYCSLDHQRAAWPSHKAICRSQNEEMVAQPSTPSATSIHLATPPAPQQSLTSGGSSLHDDDDVDEEAERNDANYPFNTLSREARDFYVPHDIERISVPDPLVFCRDYVAKNKPVVIQGLYIDSFIHLSIPISICKHK
jgi:hypothetical protein